LDIACGWSGAMIPFHRAADMTLIARHGTLSVDGKLLSELALPDCFHLAKQAVVKAVEEPACGYTSYTECVAEANLGRYP
jgi:hypothetical protein